MKKQIEQSIGKVRRWVEDHDYKGYDPADGNSSFLHAFTLGNVFLQRVLQQSALRAPFHIRPWLGVRPLESTKGRGYMACGYIKMYRLTKNEDFRQRAIMCLDWLMENRSARYSQYAWGDHFNYATRTGKRAKLEPIIVWGSLIGQAFLDAYESFGNRKYLEVAASVCDWMLNLPRERTRTGTCLSYVAFKQVSIHNSNMLGAVMLARTAMLTKNSEALEIAKEAMTYSCSRQNVDGSWYYGEKPMHHWIDNFHTGYNLDCLKNYMDLTGDRSFEPEMEKGFLFFKRNFFEPDGRPKYFHDKTYPIDIQSASQAIDTLALFSEEDSESLPLATKVAGWTIHNMQAEDGHFYYRDLGWTKVKTPMIHWGQGTMFKAMTNLLCRLEVTRVPVEESADAGRLS